MCRRCGMAEGCSPFLADLSIRLVHGAVPPAQGWGGITTLLTSVSLITVTSSRPLNRVLPGL